MVQMAATKCISCGTRNAVSARINGGVPGLCRGCYDDAGWENTHSDNGHDDPNCVANGWADQAEIDACPVCQNTTAARHQNTVAKSYRSHANCDHERTPKGRAACRKAGGPKA